MTRVYKMAIIVLVPMALASSLIEPRKLPLGVIAGGLIAIFNLRSMVRALKGLLPANSAAPKLIILGVGRLFLVFAIIIALAASRMVSLLGLAAGFTVVVFLVVFEGLMEARRLTAEDGEGM